MEAATIAIFGTATAASSAAVVAAVTDRFRKVVATTFALVAGLAPWVFFPAWQNYRTSTALLMFSMFGSGPLFLVAFFLFGVGQRTPRRGVAAGASLVGMFAGGGFSIVLFGLLSRME